MKKTILLLLLIFGLGYYLRVRLLPEGVLTFGYDQARDALVTRQILQGDIKVQGPSSSTPGLYHGIFYNYFLAPAYWLGEGSPTVAAYWVAFWNCLTVMTVFYLTFLISRKIGAGTIAAFLFAISFEGVQYATWLSNPTIGIWTVPLAYLGLWLWTKEKRLVLGPVMAALGLGLSIQANIFLAYQGLPMAIWLVINQKGLTRRQLFTYIVTLVVTISSMLISEIKFGFNGVGGMSQLLLSQDAIIASKGLGDILVLLFNQLGKVFANNSYPGNVGYGGMLVLVLIVGSLLNNKEKKSWAVFLALWLFSHVSIVSLGGASTPFLLVGVGPAVAILLGLNLWGWWEKGKRRLVVVLLLLLVFGNLAKISKENSRGSTIFAIQKDMLLSKEIKAVDYTYQQAKGQAFSLNSLTSPLWINIVWSYLYKWYGQPKYGYLPFWHGRDQIGQLDGLPADNGRIQNYFLILEPMGGIPAQYLELTTGEEDSKSKLIDQQAWGELAVQQRIKNEK